jgi:cell wall-associated NlpC family hydrolase
VLPKKFLFVAIGLTLVLAGCETVPPYSYQYNPAYTAYMEGSLASPPAKAPPIVRQAIAAGNELIGKPYRYGGGHRTFYDNAYDCSGAVSYVLHAIGRLETPTPSQTFRGYGDHGAGRWVTVYAGRGHVFLVVAGLRFDTGYGDHTHGPRWQTRSRPTKGYVLRHPPGL